VCVYSRFCLLDARNCFGFLLCPAATKDAEDDTRDDGNGADDDNGNDDTHGDGEGIFEIAPKVLVDLGIGR